MHPFRTPGQVLLAGLHGLLAAGVLALCGAASAAPQRPARVAALPAPLAPVEGEVIVGFKPQAEALRKYTLSAKASKTDANAQLTQRAAMLGGRLKRPLLSVQAVSNQAQVMKVAGLDAKTLARELAADPDVAYAVPNGRKRAYTAPNDPLYPAAATGARINGPDSGQWYLRAPSGAVVSAINIEAAWAYTQGTASTVVAVLDTGVRFDHPDLGRAASGGQLLLGYDFVSNTAVANDGNSRDDDPSDPGDWVTSADLRSSTFSGCSVTPSSWHGTATASLVAAAANNGLGMAGAAPGVRVLPVRVLGKCFGTDADIQAGMLWAAGISVAGVPDNPNPARVINLSLGGDGLCDAAYADVIAQVLARGVVIVAAAGNTAGGAVNVPANCSGVIGVTALRHAGTKVGFSDLGPEVSIAAPGGNCINITAGSPCLYPLLAATNKGIQGPTTSAWTDSYDISVGTSFSSPLVAAVVGLMVSAQPNLTPAEVRQMLQASARPFPTTGGDNGPDDPTPVGQCVAPQPGVEQFQCYCNTSLCGAGMLDAGGAMALAVGLPLANVALSPTVPIAASPVTLSASGSSGALVGYRWQLLGAGGIVSGFDGANNGVTAQLTPSGPGAFTVQLTVTDLVGQTATTTRTVTVLATPVPTAVLTVTTATPVAPSPVALSATSSLAGTGSTLSSYQWTLLDGGGIVNGFNGGMTQNTASLTPTAAGSFTVRLTVTNAQGAMATADRTVVVVVRPTATITNATATPVAGSPVTLNATGSVAGAGSTLTGYQWSLVNGGGVVTGFDVQPDAPTVSFTPSGAGTVTVQLTVTNATGQNGSSQITVAVAAPSGAGGPSGSSSGSGGGATSVWWVLGVLLAVALLHTVGRQPAGTQPRQIE